ncbi:MAG: YhbY family RNA-binding protein [Mogibacterium sp.]|nr:YhbY family RNA-binding protein [Mogibacterium sp.]
MLTGKQRSYLKGLANQLSPAASIGKAGITETLVNAIDDYLEKNELIKVSIQQGIELDAKEAAYEIAGMVRAEFVQALGRRFVLYRRQRDPDKRRIAL